MYYGKIRPTLKVHKIKVIIISFSINHLCRSEIRGWATSIPIIHDISMDINSLLIVHYNDLICTHLKKKPPFYTIILMELNMILCTNSTISQPRPFVQCFRGCFAFNSLIALNLNIGKSWFRM